MIGASAWHGPHHVAQKSRITAWPRRSLSVTAFFPDAGVGSFINTLSVKSGAAFPTSSASRGLKTRGKIAKPAIITATSKRTLGGTESGRSVVVGAVGSVTDDRLAR